MTPTDRLSLIGNMLLNGGFMVYTTDMDGNDIPESWNVSLNPLDYSSLRMAATSLSFNTLNMGTGSSGHRVTVTQRVSVNGNGKYRLTFKHGINAATTTGARVYVSGNIQDSYLLDNAFEDEWTWEEFSADVIVQGATSITVSFQSPSGNDEYYYIGEVYLEKVEDYYTPPTPCTDCPVPPPVPPILPPPNFPNPPYVPYTRCSTVENGDFSETSGLTFADWSTAIDAPLSNSITREAFGTGWAAAISRTTYDTAAIVYQTVTVTPGKIYLLECDIGLDAGYDPNSAVKLIAEDDTNGGFIVQKNLPLITPGETRHYSVEIDVPSTCYAVTILFTTPPLLSPTLVYVTNVTLCMRFDQYLGTFNPVVDPKYMVILRDTSFVIQAIFDSWVDLEYTNVVNGTGSYSFSLDANDERCAYFTIDAIFEVWRSIPSMGVGWYRDFIGFHRKPDYDYSEDGEYIFTSTGVSLNDLLGRRVVAWNAGTVKSDKNAASETAMKEIVYENCAEGAVYTGPPYVGRWSNGVFPNFSVAPTTGAGAVWTGSAAFLNVLEVLQGIAKTSGIDFEVMSPQNGYFIFYTFPTGRGANRTSGNIDATTGKNPYGYVPVVFSVLNGNVRNIRYTDDHSKGINVVIIPGAGELSTQDVYMRDNDTDKTLSPWNQIEVSRATNQDYEYQYNQYGDTVLEDEGPKEEFEFEPMQVWSCAYGLHYYLGDTVTGVIQGISRDKKILEVSVSMKDEESITLKLSE